MAPKVSVLLPAYNQEELIKQTINSVLDQTFADFELIINDDCSTDKTVDTIKSFNDSRIKASFSEENEGTVASLNKMLKTARGEYIAVIGADDLWKMEKLQKQVEYLDKNKDIAATFSYADIIDENASVLGKASHFPIDIFKYDYKNRQKTLCDFFLGGNRLCHASLLVRSDVHKEIGEYNLAYRQLHDFDLWIRLLSCYEIYIMKEPLVEYRFIKGSGSVSAGNTANNIRMYNEAKTIFRNMFYNISDDDFIKGFGNLLIKKGNLSREEIVCEKFFVLKNNDYMSSGGNTLSMDFLFDNLDEKVLECFKKEYNTDINALYEYSGSFAANCFSDSFDKAERFKKLYYNSHPVKEKIEDISALAKRGIKKVQKSIKKF